jgi:hypothetical protein
VHYLPVIVLTVVEIFADIMPAQAQQIWLSAVTPYTREAQHWNASVDYMDLFKPESPWAEVAAHTNVFKIGPGFAISGDKQQVKAVIDGLRQRGIALALETGLLVASGRCPRKDEAHITPREVEFMLNRIKLLGGDLRYVAIDEPIAYGRRPLGVTCVESLDEIAQELMSNISLVKSIFPMAEIGEIEVVGKSPQLLSDVESFVPIFEKVTGQRIAFLHTDVDWSPQALQHLADLAKFAKSNSIPFGVIYDAVGGVGSDMGWTDSAQQHVRQVESELKIEPDAAIFQTWVQYPTHLLPENRPGTLTNVVLGYLRARK